METATGTIPVARAIEIGACPFCAGRLGPYAREYGGYQAPLTFDLLQCDACRVALATPMATNADIYDVIYRNRAHIAVYASYESMADEVAASPKPFERLADLSDMYWAVAQCVGKTEFMTALEVGCGLGYMTFALRQTGKDAFGIDLSHDAVATARQRFGSHYSNQTLDDLKRAGRQFDLVIMNEVIEHVTDPYALIREALSVLEPSGTIFLTTPNRDYFPTSAIWQTEPPPVHLWWFTEAAITAMADKLDMRASFTDFSNYNRRHPDLFTLKMDMQAPRGPIIAADGAVISRSDAFRFPPALDLARHVFARLGLLRAASGLIAQAGRMRGARRPSPRRATMGIALRRNLR